MPALRSYPTRRSRRLSMQQPLNYNEDDLDNAGFVHLQDESEDKSAKIIVTKPALVYHPTALRSPSASTTPPFPCPTPQSRRRPSGHVSRPPNAFMLYRSYFWAQEKLKPEPIERDHRDISRIAAHCWNNLDETTRAVFRQQAEQRKLEHRVKHPDYKYAPTFAKKHPTKKKVKKNAQDEEERCRKLASLVMDGALSQSVEESLKHEKGSVEAKLMTIPSTSDLALFLPTPTPTPVKDEPIATPGLTYQIDDASEDDFVRTEDIPPLELPEPEIKRDEYACEGGWNLRPHSYDTIDSQFGYKPESSSLSDSSWYNSSSTGVHGETTSPMYLENSLFSSVSFTNPFLEGLPELYLQPSQSHQEPFTPTVPFAQLDSGFDDMDEYIQYDA